MKHGWDVKKLGDVCKLTNGYAFQSKEYCAEGHFVIRIGNVQDGHIELTNPRYLTLREEKQKKFTLSEGDILVSLTGNVGRVGEVKVEHLPAVLNQRVAKISIVGKDFLRDFLLHFFKSPHFVAELTKAGRGAAQQNISTTDIESLIIPFPPLHEQQRIVAILDEAFAAIDQAKANTERNLKNAKELFESYLQEVFENGDWDLVPLKELTTKIGSGATPRGGQESYKSEGISLVRSMNVHDWEFKDRNLAFIDDKQARELDGVTLQEDDVLINITGASIARCCVIPKAYLPARVNQHVSIIRPIKGLLDSKFLNLLLTSKPYKDQLLLTGEQGATRQAITKAQIELFRISIPPFLQQSSIVRKLDDLRAETQKMEVLYQKKLSVLDELKLSILQKAFAGKLTTV